VPAYYITTPIYYANDLPHIGHAYTTIAADAIARYRRQQGDDVFLVTGTDEHGINIERIAAGRGLTPSQHVDSVATAFRSLWSRLDIQYGRFVQTSEAAHRRTVLAVWDRLRDSGDLYRGVYEGAYCPRCEAYYQPDELVGEACPVHGLACEFVREENWFFRLSRYQSALERLVRETDFVGPATRRNEVLGVIKDGLTDFSVSRRQVRWGIEVPDSTDEVIYVWVDALASYLTGVGFAEDKGTFERYWPAELHLIGKEITRFHCLYWPALLLSIGLPLPKHVFAHGWLTNDGEKISKTRGNVIDPNALIDEFGSDAVRYYFLRSVPFGQDGDYTRQSFVARFNADLANDFGNLVQRTTTLASRYGAELPPASRPPGDAEATLRWHAKTLRARVDAAFERLTVHEAVAAVGDFVREVNRYLQTTAPWTLAKRGDGERLAVVLESAIDAARLAATFYAPIIPRASAEAIRRLTSNPPVVGEPLFPRLAE
jgi:methionyl-tRNA synthetase